MKIHYSFILFFLICLRGPVFGQLTEKDLMAALKNEECAQIAEVLEKTPLRSEGMKFFGAICYYRNGDTEKALSLFREVQQMKAQKQHFATFWEAKCHAREGRDSLTLACLQAIPKDKLNYKMMSDEVFGQLAHNNATFAELKKSVAPGLNGWTALLSVIALLGLLIGFVLLFGRSRFSAGEKRLSVVVFSFALILISYILIWSGYTQFFPYLQSMWPFLTLLVGPSLFLYLKDTFQEDYTWKEAALHYVIPAVSGLLSLPVIWADFGFQTGLSPDFYTIGTSSHLLTAHLLFYAVLIYFTTKNEWQVDENIKIWTSVVTRGMIAYSLAFLSYFILVRTSFFSPEWDYAISFVMALGILAVAYMGLVQKRVFSSEPIGHFIPVKKYQTSSLTESASESIKRKMERLLKEEQVFRENELRLADLAAYLDISRHQLSQVINEHYGVNFFELINRFRVNHVKRMLADRKYSHYTIIQIAYEAGFNNKASFNRYFKKEIGMTPSAYRIKWESVRENEN